MFCGEDIIKAMGEISCSSAAGLGGHTFEKLSTISIPTSVYYYEAIDKHWSDTQTV